MGRPKISTAQRISDLFCELDVTEQAAVLANLMTFNVFCRKRDAIVLRFAAKPALELADAGEDLE